jgi:antitoxin HigA-1
MKKKTKTMPPIHPGETLREDFLKPLGLTANRLAMELIVPVTRVNDIVRGKRAITADTALRLSRYFGTTPQFWTSLQANYDLELAEDARGAEPTAAWTSQQIVEAFADRDRVYGNEVRLRIASLHIEEVLTAPRVPGRTRTPNA